MGFFGDIASKVLTEYKADTSQQIAELKKLKGEEKARAQSAIEGNEKLRESYEGHIKTIGKLTLAIGSIAAAYVAAKSAFTAYAEHTKLEAAASGVSIDKLRDATKGLKTNTELLADAARLNHGAIKLTTEQMAIAEQAMLQYTRQGHDNAKAHDAVLQAVTALKIDGLKDLGVFIDTTGLSMQKESDRGEILRRVFGELTKASSAFANQNLSDAEKIEASANRVGNAIDRLKQTAGRFVAGAAREVEETSTPRGLFNATIGLGWDVGDVGGEDAVERAKFLQQNVNDPLLIAQRRRADIESGRLNGLGVLGNVFADSLSGPFASGPRGVVSLAAEKSGKSDGEAYAKALLESVRKTLETGARAGGSADLGFGAEAKGGLRDRFGDSFDILGGDMTKQLQDAQGFGRLTQSWKDRLAAQREKQKSFMESTFGPLDQFDAYKAAFDGFTGAVTAGYSAMVDGTMGFGKAFKMAVAQALKASGAQMLIESLKEAAYGVASIAVGNAASAGAHFKSSAMFLAGSVAAGVAANALGSGGGSAAGGGGTAGGTGSAAPRPSSGSPSEPAQRTVVHIIGDPYDTETNPRRRLNNAKKTLKQLDSSHYAVDK